MLGTSLVDVDSYTDHSGHSCIIRRKKITQVTFERLFLIFLKNDALINILIGYFSFGLYIMKFSRLVRFTSWSSHSNVISFVATYGMHCCVWCYFNLMGLGNTLSTVGRQCLCPQKYLSFLISMSFLATPIMIAAEIVNIVSTSDVS